MTMRKIDYDHFLRLTGAHNPFRIPDNDASYVIRCHEYFRDVQNLLMQRIDESNLSRTRSRLQEIIKKYSDSSNISCKNMNEAELEQFKYDEKERIQYEFERVAGQYCGIKDVSTGGYVSTRWTEFPRGFLKILIHQAAGTSLKIIEANKYRDYDDQHVMIEEMVENALEHGNKFQTDKNLYLLWHQCPKGREIYIADEGNKEWSFKEGVNNRRLLSAMFGKDEVSGTDILEWRSKGYEYFSIVGPQGDKKGTLLKIKLTDYKAVPCEYPGHALLE